MADVFISYASEDKASAETFAQALEQHGCSVWWDRKIPPGATFDKVISEALSLAKCVIVLWSKASIASEWVKEEAAEAVRRKILVPVLIERVEIPLGFRRIEAAKLINWHGQFDNAEFKQLVASVGEIVKRSLTLSNSQKEITRPTMPVLPRLLSIVMIALSFFLGMYLYSVTENILRGYVQRDLQTPLPHWVPPVLFCLTAIPLWIGGLIIARKAWRREKAS